jgi:RimJ/RimL family protein N-acetyltransferase
MRNGQIRTTVDTGAGLRLRRWAPGDATAVLAAFAVRGVNPAVTSGAAAEHWLRGRAEEWVAGTGYAFAVVDQYGAVLRNVAVTAIDSDTAIDRATGWVSYWTAAAVRGRGVATRGVRALADWAFGDLGLRRLELGHRAANPASCVVAVRAGFRVAGRDGAGFELHARLAGGEEITYPRLT